MKDYFNELRNRNLFVQIFKIKDSYLGFSVQTAESILFGIIMASTHVDDFIRQRFRAQKNVVQILNYQGLPLEFLRFMNPANTEEYKANWGYKISQNPDKKKERVEFERDTKPELFAYNFSDVQIGFYISYLAPSDETKMKITKARVESELTALLQYIHVLKETETSKDIMDKIETIPKMVMIFVSKFKLDGAAKNLIVELNTMLQFPIRHFTLDELQFDPTIHALAPKYMIRATQKEVVDLIELQKYLMLGRHRLAEDFDKHLDELETQSEKNQYIMETDEMILDKLQTLNDTDPMVKWRGFKVGDVIKITRTVGVTRFTYRRVVHADRVVKPPKNTQQKTNK